MFVITPKHCEAGPDLYSRVSTRMALPSWKKDVDQKHAVQHYMQFEPAVKIYLSRISVTTLGDHHLLKLIVLRFVTKRCQGQDSGDNSTLSPRAGDQY